MSDVVTQEVVVDPCERRIVFAGKERVFNLNNKLVINMVEGGQSVFSLDMFKLPAAFIQRNYRHGNYPLAGTFGYTFAAAQRRFEESCYSLNDVEQIITLGLYGGGMDAEEAFRLVAEHVSGEPILQNALIAYEVVVGLFAGKTDKKYELSDQPRTDNVEAA